MTGHPIVHIEIPAANASAAGRFYNDVFGWKIEADQTFNYVQFKSEGGPGGGLIEPAEASPVEYKPDRLLVYLSTDDIDATLATVEAHGGKRCCQRRRSRTLAGGLYSPIRPVITSRFTHQRGTDS